MIPDPHQCLHLEGDRTCVELGIGDYCDECRGENRNPGRVWWVDPDVESGAGTQAQPHGELASALANIGEDEAGVIVLVGNGTTYDPLSLTATGTKQIAIIGVGRPVLQGVTTAVRVSGTKCLYLVGVDLVGGSQAVARCTSTARLYLQDTVVRGGDGIGIEGSRRRLVAERVDVVGNGGDGVSLADDSDLTLRASIGRGQWQCGRSDPGLRLSSAIDALRERHGS